MTHDFVGAASGPNQVWLTDISEHPTREGKLYLCAVKDCYSNKIVGYSIDSWMKSGLAAAALRNAIGSRDNWTGRQDVVRDGVDCVNVVQSNSEPVG